MPIVRTEIHIPAPPQAVWAVLADTTRWALWNPVQPSFEGALVVGGRIRVGIAMGGRVLRVPARLVAVEPGHTLSWSGGVPGLFHATHGFDLTADGDGTRVEHIEIFSGVVPALGWKALKNRLLPRYTTTNHRLRDRVLAISRATEDRASPPAAPPP